MKFFNNVYMVLFLIIFVGFLLRIFLLDKFPVGFTGDEAQQGYSAYSILKTGRDEWGQFLTIFPRGFGDYKPPLYTYLTIPPVAFFGLNEFAVRFPAALFGTLMILIIYYLGKELFGKTVGIWSAFLLAISPWSLQLSRTAFEGGIGIPLFGLGLLLYLKSKEPSRFKSKNKLYLPLSFLIFGLNLYSYHSWRLFTLMFLPVLILIKFMENKSHKTLLISILIFSLFLLPLVFNAPTVIKRSSDVSIFSEKNIKNYFVNKGTSDMPVNIARVFDNKIIYIADQFLTNYLSYFSPTFFITGSRSDSSYLNFPKTPLLYPIELVFVFYGLYMLKTRNDKNMKLLITLLLLAPIPAAFTDSLNAQRATTFLPIVTIISAFGLSSLILALKSKYQNFKNHIVFFNASIIAFFLIFFIFAMYTYFYQLPKHPPHNLRYGYKEVFLRAISEENNYDSIHFSKVFTVPHIFVAYYKRMDPEVVQKASMDWLRYEKAGKQYIDQLESYNLGKYEIHDLDWKKDKLRGNVLLVSSPEDFPEDVISILDVKNPQGQIIYRMVPVVPNVEIEKKKLLSKQMEIVN